MSLLFKCPKCGARRQREGFYVRTQHCICCGWGIAEAVAARRGEQTPAGGGTSAPNPPCAPPSPCEMCNGVGFYVSLPGDAITSCPGCSQDRKQECPTCGGDPYVQPCDDCGATGHEGEQRCGTCRQFTPKHTGSGGVLYGMCNLIGEAPAERVSAMMAGCPDWSEKHSTRLTAEAVDSGSRDSAPVDGDGERS